MCGMKKKELEQLKTMPVDELKKSVTEYRDKLWTLKKDLAAGKVKNVKEIKKLKQSIAQLLTFVHQKS